MVMSNVIKERYLAVLEKISSSEISSGRSQNSVKLIVVTKGQPAAKINEAIAAGAYLLGENYPEETVKKIPEITGDVEWHMIGHLQSRKIKHIVDHFTMIHSIDRDEIALKLDAQLGAGKKVMQALFEVNLSGESSKSGYVAWDENTWEVLCDHFLELMELKSLKFCGLMTMPPYANDPEESRYVFKKCRKLLNMMQNRIGATNFNQLSMGTSLDYQVAIQEGATFVRIGEAIMGKRIYR